ncbi:tRNA threonylcarbamoyladenosine biosynthesis protein TsaB [bioreactor metagenome]|uniref:tRNA threonylcarbamoyladenosine biosynthesis protein TsaB n=1 Tax=bioreactor metagenome TaxID=1076179 RepID=A0A644ZH97_9ZZZZ
MKILAFDSTSKSAACGIWEDGKIRRTSFINDGFTHSVNLLPMVEDCLRAEGLTHDDIDLYGVTVGPGSFTGVRIGIATIKGMAFVKEKECIAVSTLFALAHNLAGYEGIIACPVMDARRNQVYNALFEVNDHQIIRLCEDRAIGISELLEELKNSKKKVILVGDGAKLCYNSVKEDQNISICEENELYLHGEGLLKAAVTCLKTSGSVEHALLNPVYLRLSQAEREQNAKTEGLK